MSIQNQVSSCIKEENGEQRGFDLNECAAIPDAEQLIDPKSEETGMEQVNGLQIESYSVNGLKVGCQDDTLADTGMGKSTNGDDMGGVRQRRKKKKVKLELPHGDVRITRRVLRSSSAAKQDLDRSDEYYVSVEDKRKGVIKGKLSGVNSCVKVKTEVEQSPKVEEVHEADFESETKMEHMDGGSCDQDANVVSHDQKQKFKRKRGRPRKLQISSQSHDGGSSLPRELGRSLDLCSQQTGVDGLNSRLKRGRPPKTQETAEDPCIRGKKMKHKRGRTPKMTNQNISDSVYEPRRLKSNCGGRANGPEFDGGKHRGRKKIARKRGRPPKPQKEMSSGKTDNSDSEAKKSLKIHGSFSESQANDPSVDREMRRGQETDPNEREKQSKSGAKKLLKDRILQLLLAAGWKVDYRPRNGREYNDAVYVNPEGKTHWSVTLAYKVYKKQMESCMNDREDSTAGSDFALLSEEELNILERKTHKKRCDKGKRRPKWEDRDVAEDMVTVKRTRKKKLHAKKLQKDRPRMQESKISTSYHARPLQKKLKGSHSLENLGCVSRSRLSNSVTKRKREEKHASKRCAPLARSSLDDADSKDDGYTLYEGKRTILGWMIDSAILPLNGKIQCMNCMKTEVLLEGTIRHKGIQCDCCGEVFSISDFEIHAGGKLSQALESLYLEGGISILQCLLDSWNKQDESQLKGFHVVDVSGGDPNDDTCGICGDGGDLICCDGCPSTFHQSCLDIKIFPSGSWYCFYCSCKFCGEVESANDDSTAQSPLLSCCLCEEKYHQACIMGNSYIASDRSNHSFCGMNCQELFEGLQLLIGEKQVLPEGFSWSFLHRFDLTSEVSPVEVSDKIVCNSKLAVAFSVMDECFSPLVDHRSGINLLQNIVYNFGSNFSRLNYSGFLTAILEKGDEIIAVASIRIHGNQLAEMPFIGTRYMYRRQGMCRRLMSGIESALGSLRVEKLVIPAVPELTATWTSGFGFKPVDDMDKKAIKNLNLMVFPGVDMLEKPLLKYNTAEANLLTSNGYLPLVSEMCQQIDVKANKPEGICSPKLDLDFLGQKSAGSAHDGNCGTADVKSPMHLADSCSRLEKNEEVEGNNDTESNPKLSNGCSEDKHDMEKVTGKDLESHAEAADSCVGDRTDWQKVMDNERNSDSLVGDGSHQDKTDTKREKNGDVEMCSQVSDGCCGGKTEMTKETDLQGGCDIKELSQSVTDGETKELSKREASASALETQERSECHHVGIPSQTDTRTLENIVAEQKMHLFECQII